MRTLNLNAQGTGRISEITMGSTKAGTPVFNTSLAVDDSYRDSSNGEWIERTEWVKIEAYGGIGEACEKVLSKGDLVTFSGTPKADSYDKDGKRVNRLVIVVEDFALRIRARGGSEKTIEQMEHDAVIGNYTSEQA